MMELFLFVIFAVVFLASIYLFVRPRARVEGSALDVLRAREDLSVLQSGLLPAEIVERIFAKADYEFLLAESTKEVQELFLAERKRLALLWAGYLLQRIRNLQQFHLGSARFYSRLRLGTEIRLASEFFSLLWFCRALQFVIYLRGPYAAPRMAGRVAAAAATVCATSEEVMNFLKPAQAGGLAKESARKLSVM
ncbi:MAG TPA: hypothetical protein VG322_02760 [Candidatus Acidoferrales bacterium]|jgi:hypothetical protein|nr:hypothetical protein [Candidatus Acidoferrales bacterium]